MGREIHALSMRTLTPAQWRQESRRAELSLGGRVRGVARGVVFAARARRLTGRAPRARVASSAAGSAATSASLSASGGAVPPGSAPRRPRAAPRARRGRRRTRRSGTARSPR
jgi:hypothetical protein